MGLTWWFIYYNFAQLGSCRKCCEPRIKLILSGNDLHMYSFADGYDDGKI